jgi:hypothetical protein
VFASTGFTPVQASTFGESKAESLLHKVPIRGFRVEKRAPGSLCLYLTFVCRLQLFKFPPMNDRVFNHAHIYPLKLEFERKKIINNIILQALKIDYL